MAGIYIHIPFCKTRCIYCDFYSTTRSEIKDAYIQALCKELETRQAYLSGEPIETIYFGGGTPSQLAPADFEKIFDTINRIYNTENCREITLEANPDDLTAEYLKALSELPLNRISIGIQTFNDEVLKLLKRRHTASQAIQAVQEARLAGFDNISIDLIYGLPGSTPETWKYDLSKAIDLHVEHLSAYHLIYEEGTALHRMLQEKHIQEVSEDSSLFFFKELTEQLGRAGYEHYEISNFCLPGKHSRHNSSYWEGIKYLGCGPSAHSFDGQSREWNVSSITAYIQGIEQGDRKSEIELLDKRTQYNDFIVTRLRTRRGISISQLEADFGREYIDYTMKAAQKYINREELTIEEDRLHLTYKGIFISDSIMSDLLRVDE